MQIQTTYRIKQIPPILSGQERFLGLVSSWPLYHFGTDEKFLPIDVGEVSRVLRRCRRLLGPTGSHLCIGLRGGRVVGINFGRYHRCHLPVTFGRSSTYQPARPGQTRNTYLGKLACLVFDFFAHYGQHTTPPT